MRGLLLLACFGAALAMPNEIFRYKDEETGVEHYMEGEPGVEVTGGWRFEDPEGKELAMTYIANNMGFQPESDSLPMPVDDTEEVKQAKEEHSAMHEWMKERLLLAREEHAKLQEDLLLEKAIKGSLDQDADDTVPETIVEVDDVPQSLDIRSNNEISLRSNLEKRSPEEGEEPMEELDDNLAVESKEVPLAVAKPEKTILPYKPFTYFGHHPYRPFHYRPFTHQYVYHGQPITKEMKEDGDEKEAENADEGKFDLKAYMQKIQEEMKERAEVAKQKYQDYVKKQKEAFENAKKRYPYYTYHLKPEGNMVDDKEESEMDEDRETKKVYAPYHYPPFQFYGYGPVKKQEDKDSEVEEGDMKRPFYPVFHYGYGPAHAKPEMKGEDEDENADGKMTHPVLPAYHLKPFYPPVHHPFYSVPEKKDDSEKEDTEMKDDESSNMKDDPMPPFYYYHYPYYPFHGYHFMKHPVEDSKPEMKEPVDHEARMNEKENEEGSGFAAEVDVRSEIQERKKRQAVVPFPYATYYQHHAYYPYYPQFQFLHPSMVQVKAQNEGNEMESEAGQIVESLEEETEVVEEVPMKETKPAEPVGETKPTVPVGDTNPAVPVGVTKPAVPLVPGYPVVLQVVQQPLTPLPANMFPLFPDNPNDNKQAAIVF